MCFDVQNVMAYRSVVPTLAKNARMGHPSVKKGEVFLLDIPFVDVLSEDTIEG